MLSEDCLYFKNILEKPKTELNYAVMRAIIYNLKISGRSVVDESKRGKLKWNAQ